MADFDISALDRDADFDSVVGEIRAGDCGPQDVTLSLTSADGSVSESIALAADELTPFSLELGELTEATTECAQLIEVARVLGDPEGVAVVGYPEACGAGRRHLVFLGLAAGQWPRRPRRRRPRCGGLMTCGAWQVPSRAMSRSLDTGSADAGRSDTGTMSAPR